MDLISNIFHFDQDNRDEIFKTRFRMEAGNPVGLWDDGAVLAIVMVEEVQNTKEIVCLG